MSEPSSYSYLRYLRAKETVDERARNERVWSEFIEQLTKRSSAPLRILEVGAGEGATAERIVDALDGRPVHDVEYTLVDVVPEHLDAAADRLRRWANDKGLESSQEGERITLSGSTTVRLHFVSADLFEYARAHGGQFDAVVAQAVLDILPLTAALDGLRGLLRDHGLWYLPIHFDGVTAFEPPISSTLDARIEALYHRSMSTESDEEGGIAGARTGRRLLHRFRQSEATLVDAGSSDWIVFAEGGGYRAEEAYFLHHILHIIEEELSGHPNLDSATFNRWVAERRRQIERGDLVYVAHQLDVLGQKGGAP